LRTEKDATEKGGRRVTDISLQWLYAAEQEAGGISAWKTEDGTWHNAYQEVTGYLLPTLLSYSADDLALRCANWLMDIQNDNGSWNGLDGIQRPFDTSAIIEGLNAVANAYYDSPYLDTKRCIIAIEKARHWISTQVSPMGYLYNSPTHLQPEIYNLRASAIIGNVAELYYWKSHGLNHREARSHYVAYALEGALNIDNTDAWAVEQIQMAYVTQTGFVPFYVTPDWRTNHPSPDYCATAQMGILYHRVGLDAGKVYRLLKSVIEPNGGLFQSSDDKRQISWAVKFFLDFKKVMA
jgi:hypothetical protein